MNKLTWVDYGSGSAVSEIEGDGWRAILAVSKDGTVEVHMHGNVPTFDHVQAEAEVSLMCNELLALLGDL